MLGAFHPFLSHMVIYTVSCHMCSHSESSTEYNATQYTRMSSTECTEHLHEFITVMYSLLADLNSSFYSNFVHPMLIMSL